MSDRGEKGTVLITGTSSGFGKLAAQTLLDEAYTVFATMRAVEGRNAEAVQALHDYAKGLNGKLHVLELDVTEDDSVHNAVSQALDLAGGRLDVVINNAGIGVGGFSETFTTDQWAKILDINVLGVHRVNRAVLPSMRQAGRGLLIHVSSVMGRIVIPFAAPYTASKFAMEGMVESLCYELAATGIDAVIVEPGGFGTGFGERMLSPNDEERVASYGELAKMPEQLWSGMMEQLTGGEAPDPQVVADAIVRLIETPVGERPLRTVVDPMTGGDAPKTINQTTDEVQRQLLEAFGMGGLRSAKAA